MVARVRTRLRGRRRSRAARPLVVLGALACCGVGFALGGCGSGLRDGDDATADVGRASAAASCAPTVLDALRHVAMRVYEEGVSSERTGAALHLIGSSTALRKAVEAGDARATQAVARELIASGHLTNLRVVRAGQVLAAAGTPGAVAPLQGTLLDAAGAPIGTFVTTVWNDAGVIAETNGIDEVATVLRAGERTIAGSFALPAGKLPQRGTITRGGVTYEYTSYEASKYPTGEPMRVYLVRNVDSTRALCGGSAQDTVVNTISHVAHLIYAAEAGRRTLQQVRRVQRSQPLLEAVANHDPVAARRAVEALLNQHIVRLRVSAGGQLLTDVGGPFVLAPVRAPLLLGGRVIGSFVLSIQDDEGYKRLARRLAGLDVVMYMGNRLVKSTVGSSPGPIPTDGAFQLDGRSFRCYTFKAEAFPSGPLRITVLIPMPYS